MRGTFIFNETSPSSSTTVASSKTVQNAGSNYAAGVAGPMGDYDAVHVSADLQGATGGSLQVFVQSSPDDGTTWLDIIAFPKMAAGQSLQTYSAPVSNATTTSVPIAIGKNLAPALAVGVSAGAVVNGAFSDRMRLVMVAGISTTLGASVVVRVAPQRSERNR